MSELDYTIGDEVVCIETHPYNIVKEGQLFTVKGLLNSNCKCPGYIVDVGLKTKKSLSGMAQCDICKSVFPDSEIQWLYAKRFKKLDTLVNINELLEVLEQPAFNNL